MIDSRRLIENMERVPVDLIAASFELYCSRMDTEEVGFVLTIDGVDKYVLCPYHWYQPDKELMQFEVETELLEQVTALIEPMGINHEELIRAFFQWCVDPATRDEAVAYLKNAIEAQGEK